MFAGGSAQILPSTYMRVNHFRPNVDSDSFLTGLTYMLVYTVIK